MFRRLHTVICVVGAALMMEMCMGAATAAATVSESGTKPAGIVAVEGEASATASAAPELKAEDASHDAMMRQGAISLSVRSDDDENGVLAMLMEQQDAIELTLAAHFGSNEVRVLDIVPAMPEDVGHAADPESAELQHARITFEMAAPEESAAGMENLAVLQFSLQQSLDEADARLAIDDLVAAWDEGHAAAGEESSAKTPSASLIV